MQRQNDVKLKNDVEIMDAPLSKEGILEALHLYAALREYSRSTALLTTTDNAEQRLVAN